MPMDLPGGISSVKQGRACQGIEACMYTNGNLGVVNEHNMPMGAEYDGPVFLGSYKANSAKDAQWHCSRDKQCSMVVWNRESSTARLYSNGSGDSTDHDLFSIPVHNASLDPRGLGQIHSGMLQKKIGCRPPAGQCGGAILKDDTKSRSQGVPVRTPAPGDSFYDPAAFRNVCVACTPENNRIRSTVRPVLGPGPNRSVDRMVTQHRESAGYGEGPETVVFRPETKLTPVVLQGEQQLMTISEALDKLKSSSQHVGFYAPATNPNTKDPVNITFVSAKWKHVLEYNPEYISFVKEETFFSYVEAANDYRSYSYSRCRSIPQRQCHGERVDYVPYFSKNGKPLHPSDSRAQGPPNYKPVGCPLFLSASLDCGVPYKTSNSRFNIQGATTSSSRLARLKYEELTRGTNFTTAGSLHAKNFGELSAATPSGYFLPQNATVANCRSGLYRRSGKRVGCFTPEPRDIDRIEH